MNISWTLGISGDFATALNWTPAAVPGPSDDAIIDVKGTYTVTSSVDETVDNLTLGNKHATLLISGSSFTTTSGGVNNGTIDGTLDVGTTAGSATLTNLGQIDGTLVIAGDVSLQGNGKLTLSGNDISGNGSPATLSTDNVISGGGTIFSGSSPPGNFTLVNEIGGIIDATGVNNYLAINSILVENSGILEATNPQGLSAPRGLYIMDSTINNTPLGIIEAHGANTSVLLLNDTVVGGTLETVGQNAVINAGVDGGATFDGTQSGNPVNIEGNVIVEGHADLVLMGTINNTASITTVSVSTGAWIVIQGDVTLEGGGHITLASEPPNPPNVGAIWGGVLTNVDNVISGTGVIGLDFGFGAPSGSLNNEAQGVIDATADAYGDPLILAGVGPDTNAGLIEATHSGTLLIENLTIDNYIDTTNGTVEAGQGSTVGLENATIVDGLVTALHGAMIEAEQGSSTITGALVTNAGTIGAEGANLTIVGDVTNTGTLDANNATLVVDGTVSGGKATLEGTGEIEFGGPSSANTTFAANSDAILKLDAPSAFTGTVSGLTTGDYIDLTNINFADNPTLSYSSKTHVLTVTDNISDVTDSITFKGAVGSFSAQSDGSGGTFITDPPPPENMVAVSHDQFVFAANLGENSAANFNSHNDTIDPPKSEFADFAALLNQALQDGVHPITYDATDITHHTEALTAQHAHGFLV